MWLALNRGVFSCVYMNKRWYLVQCKPRESFRAELHLKNQNHDCFHPTYVIKRKRAGVIQSIVEPLFPHYLFILLNDTENWSKIRSTRGVSRVVHFNGVPARVSQQLVEGLKRQCARLNGQMPEPLFKVGDRVVVTEGCFKQLEAIVTAISGEERVMLLLNLFHREQQVELTVNAIEKAS